MNVSQSTIGPQGNAMFGVDGNTSSIWWHNSCSYTSKDNQPWWRVDLALVYHIWHVVVTHFQIPVLRDFSILMSATDIQSSSFALCANYSAPPRQIGISHVSCEQPPMQARYVLLRAYGSNMRLMLCEVQVFAQRPEVTCPLLAPVEGEIYNDTCMWNTKFYNDTCEVSCKLGYNLTSSDSVHRCTEHGTWSNNVTCEVVKCPLIKKADNEIYNNMCTTATKVYNDTCEVSCEVGYNLTSSDGVRRCTEHGTWSNSVTCERTLH
ncbi:hypothetical protein LSAT2_027769 [Lamellibrachia satsuma]|nr:hypothetical protein LSAT2_027769 [Lamellibrachia satsuma]